MLAQLDRNRHLLAELLGSYLPMARYTPPEGTYLGWLDFRGYRLSRQGLVSFFAERAGVTMVDGADFGPPGAGFLRLNFATTPAILTAIVLRLAHALKQGA